MELVNFTYTARSGWSVNPLPALDSDKTLVLVFGATSFMDDPAALKELKAAYPSSHVIGCSSSGEIFDTKISDESLSVAVAKFDKTELRTARVRISGSDTASFDAGKQIAEKLNSPNLRGVVVISDGLQVNGTKLIQGLNAVLPDSVVVTGGLAGDGSRFERTWTLADDVPQSGFVSAVGLYGDNIMIGHGSKGGWDKFGPERVITKSEGNVLFELDGKPALELYKTYLGDRASGLPATGLLFPLAVRTNANDEKSLTRTLLAVDEANQSMTFAGDLPNGGLVQLMRADLERLIDGAGDAALLTKERAPEASNALGIAVSCVGRRLVLGERTEEEVESVMDILPNGTKLVGFYSYGEISPYATGYCDLHNQTMTLTTIAER